MKLGARAVARAVGPGPEGQSNGWVVVEEELSKAPSFTSVLHSLQSPDGNAREAGRPEGRKEAAVGR